MGRPKNLKARFVHEFRQRTNSLRFGGFTILLFVIIVFGVATLSPTVATYVSQQQEINILKEQLAKSEKNVAEQKEQLDNWQDSEYIKAQARDRLFYVLPGESQLGIINDIDLDPEAEEVTEQTLTKTENNWVKNVIGSIVTAGQAPTQTE